MDEKETLIKKVTEKATKEAKSKKLNEAQTILYVEEEVNKAVAEYEAENTAKVPVADTQEVNNNVVKTTVEAKTEITEEAQTEKTYIVTTPVKNFNGEVAGVQFAYGKAEVKPGWVLNWFKEHGYNVTEK